MSNSVSLYYRCNAATIGFGLNRNAKPFRSYPRRFNAIMHDSQRLTGSAAKNTSNDWPVNFGLHNANAIWLNRT